jgi:cysteine-rich repeat protein
VQKYFVGGVLTLFGCGTPTTLCGDGAVASGEACDDNNNTDGDGCRADCFGAERCGDFLLDVGEVCDDGNIDSGDGCSGDCSKREFCGDTFLDAGEECDDGNNLDADGCEADCSNPSCQNDIIDPSELCTGIANDSRVDALPLSLRLADVNNDGFVDLLSSNAGTAFLHTTPELAGTISVLFGQGNGRFTNRADYPVHRSPQAFITAELTGDSFVDIAVINKDTDALSVLRNQGNGTFAPEDEYNTGEQPASLIAFDRDGDGDLDLATVDTIAAQVSLFINDGSGLYTPTETIAVNGFPRSISSADLDQDGKNDLVVVRLNDQKISVFLQRGAGWQESELEALGFPVEITSDDFDQDGLHDLAVAYSVANEVGVFYGDGSGGFAIEKRFATGENPAGLRVGDINNDLRPDLIVLNKGDDDASVLLSESNRSFSPEQRVQDLVLFSSFAVGDVNNDGRLDLSLGVNLSSFARTFFGDGDGTFNTSPALSTVSPTKLARVDFDQDQLPDIVVLTAEGLSFFQNRGDGHLDALTKLSQVGITDVVTTLNASNTPEIAAVSSDGLLLLLDGLAAPVITNIGGDLSAVVAGGVAGDTLQDLVLFDSSTKELRIFERKADDTLEELTSLFVDAEISELSIQDIDADGNEDIVALLPELSSLRIFFGDSAGLFTAQDILLTFAPLAHLFVSGAFKVVGRDILTSITQPQPREFEVIDVALPGAWSSLATTDLNVDGALDLLLTDVQTGELAALEMNTLTIVKRYQVEGPSQLIVVDLSQDTLDELLILEPSKQRFRIFYSNP